jgi:hypothetical protein
MTLCRALFLFCLAAFAAGCASVAGLPPGTPAEQVRARFGPPEEMWKNPDGSEVWEYREGPAGFYTYMVVLGPEHAVRAVNQVLQDQFFSKVTPGLSRDEVHRLLGKPKEIVQFPRLGEEVWSWRYFDSNVWHYFFNVHFAQATGAVLRVSRIEDPDYTSKDGPRR